MIRSLSRTFYDLCKTPSRLKTSMSRFFSKQQVDDDIEYNITFSSVPTHPVGTEPVVFMLGWLASRDKALAKYSVMYENAGCITVRYIHPPADYFFADSSHSKNLQNAAEKLVMLLDDYDLKNHPIYVHSFSNGGYYVYRYLADVLHAADVNMIGVCCDSAPGDADLSMSARAILNSDGLFPNKLAAYCCVFVFFFIYAFQLLQRCVRRNKSIYQYMRDSPHHNWPHLFLYSTIDVVIPAQHVVAMAEARRLIASRDGEGGAMVETHNFRTSPHVRHRVMHTDEYDAKCTDFLARCLLRSPSPPVSDLVKRDKPLLPPSSSNH